MIPVLAIVGRPNVGKSTLFNRLTKTRNALVADLPGLTRDRQYGEAFLEEQRFIVIDTGGISEQEEEGVEHLMVGQSWLAAQEADALLFVVDGRSECTAADLSIAQKIRTLNKPCFLAVNKIDGVDADSMVADYYQLGLGEPHPMAAAHGRGIEQLIEIILEDISVNADENTDVLPEEPGIKVAIVGRPNVGKSTLINRVLGEERVVVYDEPGTTRDSIFVPVQRQGQRYTFIDTAGVRRRGRIFETVEKFSVVKTLQAVETANVVVVVVDAREGITDQDLKLLGFVMDTGRSVVIAVNKWDGMQEDAKEAVRNELDRRLVFIDYAKIHHISALHGSGVGNLFASINAAYAAAMQPLSTAKLTRILQEAIAKHAPPLVGGRRIKLSYAHPGGHNPPIVVIHGNRTEHLPASYQRYLSTYYREALKLVGTPVRLHFKTSHNPYKDRAIVLTERQKAKRKRMMDFHKKKK